MYCTIRSVRIREKITGVIWTCLWNGHSRYVYKFILDYGICQDIYYEKRACLPPPLSSNYEIFQIWFEYPESKNNRINSNNYIAGLSRNWNYDLNFLGIQCVETTQQDCTIILPKNCTIASTDCSNVVEIASDRNIVIMIATSVAADADVGKVFRYEFEDCIGGIWAKNGAAIDIFT